MPAVLGSVNESILTSFPPGGVMVDKFPVKSIADLSYEYHQESNTFLTVLNAYYLGLLYDAIPHMHQNWYPAASSLIIESQLKSAGERARFAPYNGGTLVVALDELVHKNQSFYDYSISSLLR